MPRPALPHFHRNWRIVAFIVAVMAAYYLLTQHAAHTFGVLPYLLILACPLMHWLGHRRGHHHGKDDSRSGAE